MDISLISPDCLRVKFKKGALVSDPTSTVRTKSEAQVIILLDEKVEVSTGKIEGFRLIIDGEGEYEIEGVKISSYNTGNGNISYFLRADNLETILTYASSLKKIQEIVKESQVVILKVDAMVPQSLIIDLSPNVVVFYGEKAEGLAKTMDGKNLNTTNKFQITKEKLPTEMQIALLK